MITKKQEQCFDLVAKTGMNVGPAMRAVGYSNSSSKRPQQLTKGKGWNDLLLNKLPHEFAFNRHKYLMKRKDGLSVARALDMYYKINGMYQQNINVDKAVIVLPRSAVDKYKINVSDDVLYDSSIGIVPDDKINRVRDTIIDSEGVNDDGVLPLPPVSE